MKYLKTYEEKGNNLNEGAITTLLMAGVLLTIFLRKLTKDIKDIKYQKIFIKILNDINDDDLVEVTTNSYNILIRAGRFVVIVDKERRRANFFEADKNGLMPISVMDGKMMFHLKHPLKLSDDQYEFLINGLKDKKNIKRY